MKLKIGRENFLSPMQRVGGVVERRQSMPILANVLLEAEGGVLRITATDLEVELKSSIEEGILEEGRITVPGRKLHDILKALPEGAEVELSTKGEGVQVRSGRSRFSLGSLSASEFPSLESNVEGVSVEIGAEDFRHLLDGTAFAMAQQDVRYYLNGLLLEIGGSTVRAVATDGHRLGLAECGLSSAAEGTAEVIVPRKGIMEVIRILDGSTERVIATVGRNHVRFVIGNTTLTSKLIDGRFPDYNRVLPKGGDKIVSVSREILRSALNRTSILSNEKYRGVRFEISEGTMKLQAQNPELDAAEEEIEVDYSGPGLEIGFNANYVLDAIGAIRDEQVRMTMTDSNSSCLIQGAAGGTQRYVVMPMRL